MVLLVLDVRSLHLDAVVVTSSGKLRMYDAIPCHRVAALRGVCIEPLDETPAVLAPDVHTAV